MPAAVADVVSNCAISWAFVSISPCSIACVATNAIRAIVTAAQYSATVKDAVFCLAAIAIS
jgi:hypothetical protein